jgi:hypothetical protein
MEDKLRYVLSVRTLIEMTLLRAGRIASVASIEELMKAVRALKASGGLPPSMPDAQPKAPVKKVEATAKPTASPLPSSVPNSEAIQETVKTPTLDRQAILDDPRLNNILKSMPGTKIIDIKEK